MNRRDVLAGLLSMPVSGALAQQATGVLSIVVGSPPGGSSDASVRVLATQLGKELGRVVLTDNRPGAYWMVSARYASRRPPDGSTIAYLPSGPAIINSLIAPDNAVDATRDLTPLCLTWVVPMVLIVAPSLPVRTMAAFVDYAKARPLSLNYGSAAATHRLATELLMLETGTEMTLVPYAGSGPMMVALLAGEIQAAVVDIGSALPALRAGARILVVASLERSPQAADVPTSAEVGFPGFDIDTWGGLFAPPKTPEALVASLNDAIDRSLRAERVKALLADLAFEPAGGPPGELVARIERDRTKYERIVRQASVKL